MATIGSQVTFAIVFTDDDSLAADPTTVRFYVREHIDDTELAWTYDASPVSGVHYPVGMNPVVRDSAGNFHLVWVFRKAERHTGVWRGSGTINQTGTTTVLVRHTEIEAIE